MGLQPQRTKECRVLALLGCACDLSRRQKKAEPLSLAELRDQHAHKNRCFRCYRAVEWVRDMQTTSGVLCRRSRHPGNIGGAEFQGNRSLHDCDPASILRAHWSFLPVAPT